jgi:hypothetical protein
MNARAMMTAVVLTMTAAACGGGDSANGTTTTTTAGPTTTAPAATTTTTAARVYSDDDLPNAVLNDGDPWVVAIVGSEQFPLTIDDVWPADVFPEQRSIYEDAGFQGGSFAALVEDDALVITGAHLFADAAGAGTALDLLESSFGETELVAAITDLPPGSLSIVEPLESNVGDRSTAVRISGPYSQVIGVIWTQGNLLQFIRIGMAAGDDAREAAAFTLAAALADRME